jgi:hypothetical protein
MTENRYKKINATHKINGYYFQRTNESINNAFDRAKNEAISNLQSEIDTIRDMDGKDFFYILKKGR